MVTESRDRALPIKVDPTSNGEFRPVPLTKPLTQANVLARERIGAHAKRLGVGRRTFLQSLCGAATTLATFNEAFAARVIQEAVFGCQRRRPMRVPLPAVPSQVRSSSSMSKHTWSIPPARGGRIQANIGNRSLPTFPMVPVASVIW